VIEISLAIAAATKAIGVISKGLKAGKEAQDMASQFSTFFDAKDKIDTAKTESENPTISSKVFAKQSVESYALEVALAEHKTKDMEKQLRELFVYSGQADIYKSMMRTRQKERQRRLKVARAAAEHKKLIADITLIAFIALAGISVIAGFVYLII
jgi:ABC-type branched-subunit amino acid transport system ATPase component